MLKGILTVTPKELFLIKMPRAIFIWGQIDKLILEISEFKKNEEKFIPLQLYFKISSQ